MQINLKNICKNYSEKEVLKSIDVEFASGKINALLGENGAGKSTLAKILAGDITPDSGNIILDGIQKSFSSSKDSLDNGIVLVHQKPLLSSAISVKDNIFLFCDYFEPKIIFSNKKAEQKKLFEQKLSSVLEKWTPSLNTDCRVKDIGGDLRFYTALIGALLREPRCLILDEPSALLNTQQRIQLYFNLNELCSNGTTVIVITHNKSEAVEYAHTVTLLSDGAVFKQFNSGKEYKDFLLDNNKVLPQNNSNSNTFSVFMNTKISSKEKSAVQKNSFCFEAENLTAFPKNKPALLNASFKVFYNSITIVTGLQESALGTLEDIICGMNDFKAEGKITFDNRQFELKKGNYTSAFLRKNKVAVVPSDRNLRGSHPALTVKQLLTVYCTDKFEKTLTDFAEKIISNSGVNTTPQDYVSSLSGGMLQRLILERELSLGGNFIILCEPLQGLDSSAQKDFCERLLLLRNSGKAILILGTSDFPVGLCDFSVSMEGGKTL